LENLLHNIRPPRAIYRRRTSPAPRSP
jgi:hypothetical protein